MTSRRPRQGDEAGCRGGCGCRGSASDSPAGLDARFAEILRIAPDAIITTGTDLAIQLFNISAERMFGYRAEEVIGRPLDILIPERYRAAHRAHVGAFRTAPFTSRRMDDRAEVVGLRKDGSEFPAAASVSKQEVAGETVFTVVMMDITDRKQAEQALVAARNAAEVANLAKSKFLATMSHDLRTPLNSILGFAEIIADARLGPLDGKYREYGRDIKRSGEHLLALVSLILDLTAVESGTARLARESVGVAPVLGECAHLVADAAMRRGLTLTVTPAPNGASVHADRRALVQILLNLLSNAIAYTPAGGRVALSAAVEDGNVHFRIADTGPGIAPEDLLRIQEPFVRGEKDPYKSTHGWGLGLAIVRALVCLHGGRLDIDSRPGAGTRATVILPVG